MRKQFLPLIIVLASLLALPSCGDRELLNSEADIIEMNLPDTLMVGTPIITNTEILIPKLAVSVADIAKLEEQLKEFIPEFVITQGASITDTGVKKDFSNSAKHTYTVTSENGKWKKDYTVLFFTAKFDPKEFHFENIKTNPSGKPFHIFYEIDENNTEQNVWASGNQGFAVTAGATPVEEYPTCYTPNGKIGKGVKLTTCSTGTMGASMGKPIAAGNLFLGEFKLNVIEPLKSTFFGIQTTMNKPKSVQVWCKYKAGAEYKDKSGNVLNVTDQPDIYAVLYEPIDDADGKPIKLNGTNATTAPNIISIAQISREQIETIRVDDLENAEYQHIEMPFKSLQPFNVDKQISGKYYFTLVFSSSMDGAAFEGALGSSLYVDEAKIITE